MTVADQATRISARQTKLLADALQEHMALYGYQLIETPIIENADLFLTKAGDMIAERLFTFERHGKVLALRPEFTAAAAHLYVSQHHDSVVRWQFSGSIFIDHPLGGSERFQQHSAGAELIGLAGPAADAEITSMAAHGLFEQGLHTWKLILGHVGLTRHLLGRYALDARTQRFILNHRHLLTEGPQGRERLLEKLGKYFPTRQTSAPDDQTMSESSTQDMLDALLDTSRSAMTMGGRSRHDIARRLLRKRQQAAQAEQIDEAIDFLQGWMTINSAPAQALEAMAVFIGDDPIAHSMLEDWQQILKQLETYQIPADHILIQPDLARNWDYYTGMVFEIQSENGHSLAGGGRYDDLTRLLGADASTSAVGFAYDVDALMLVLSRQNTRHAERMIHLQNRSEELAPAIQWAQMLRQRGVRVVLNNTPPEPAILLRIMPDSLAYLGDRAYSSQEIELLVTTLKGN